MPGIQALPGLARCCLALLLAGAAVAAPDDSPAPLLGELDDFPHAVQVATSQEAVVDYEVGLGAMQKHLGDWQFKHSRRVNGERLRYTWQITDGFSSEEVYRQLTTRLSGWEGSEQLFSCEGRSCGNGAQWANLVFGQRVLYGRADAQRYTVFSFGGEQGYLVLAYAAARTTDRQYLHAEVIDLAP
ncbi:DUF4892 domain-containing protein [Parahaliea aestuarii]|uniref:DUF4892 domain-containing protein n=1 Tax=Parahaliea aestuarii TaxID=1852021 RepID=UPI00164EDE45|nr:DUF4892 domain-containing protein [Parahaliea aestuarii]